jgi:organic radical activating enzyme
MNIALTYYCNQRCTFCFGKDAMRRARGTPSAKVMTMANLRKAIAFLKRSDQDVFRMIGGEPTLHPHFEKIYRTVEENGLGAMLFSNGVMDARTVDFLSGRKSLKAVLLNIRQPQEYAPRDWEKLCYTLERLGGLVNLSFRIYRLDFDPRFLFDLIDRYRLTRLINWAIACPSLQETNDFLPLAQHKKAVNRMVRFAAESHKRKIGWFTDSGFILCAFTPRTLRVLRETVGFVPDTNCAPPLEVSPDLHVYRCYGMAGKTDKGLSLSRFNNEQQMQEYFFKRSAPLKRLGALDECFSCEHMIHNSCSGGCLVHVLKRLPSWQSVPALF